jgi:hypothetical protein
MFIEECIDIDNESFFSDIDLKEKFNEFKNFINKN